MYPSGRKCSGQEDGQHPSGACGRTEVSEVVRMRKPNTDRKRRPKAGNEHEVAPVIHWPAEAGDVDMITRWINIADQALGNRVDMPKSA